LTPAEQYHAVVGRKIDLFFVSFRARSSNSELHSERVAQDLMMVAVSARSPLARKRKLDLKDLEPMFFVWDVR
jgi:DNA-binding transcriptional LysR family regulator